ncbi:MAG TPA: tagatose 1,6-diphosphate aldolase [Beijerinckiaceae bacterium]
MEFSGGKYRALRRLADERGFFRMIAVDQRPPIRKLVAERRGVPEASYEDVGAVKALLIEELSAHSSAMLLDPGYAYPYAFDRLDPRKGLLLTLEQFEFEERPRGRVTRVYPGWSVGKIKRLGADGVKLMLFYRPDADPAVNAEQQALVEGVGRECREHDIAFLLEPLVYPFADQANATHDYVEDASKRPELVIETVREFAKPRYGIDIFKLETPIPAKDMPDPDGSGPAVEEARRAYREIDALTDRPWVMLSAGAGMEPFRRICAFAFAAGASGYLAGRALWWQAFQRFPDLDAVRRELRRESTPYIEALVERLHRTGTPWTGRPAFRDGIRLAKAGPAFFRDYGT